MPRKYRFTGEAEQLIPDISRIVQPGEVIETDAELHHPDLQPVADRKKGGADE